jgi:DNA polymerase delta subunit 1
MSMTGAFPKASLPGDVIIQVSTTFARGGEAYAKTVVCLGDTAPVDDVEIVCVDTEHDLFDTWAALLRRERTDVMIGWNTAQFDWVYLHGRSMVCADDATGDSLFDLKALGRMVVGGGEVIERQLKSSAYGDNAFSELATPGVLNIDVMQWFRKNRQHDSYSLQNISKEYLGDQKLDLPAHEIFRKFKGTPQDRADIAAYAVKDTELPLRLLGKLNVLPDLFEMANAVRIPVAYVQDRGQQASLLTFAIVCTHHHRYGLLAPHANLLSLLTRFAGPSI